MKKIMIIALFTAGLLPAVVACNETDEYIAPQPYVIDWSAAADSATTALVDYFWNDNGFFNSNSISDDDRGWNYWCQAHAMDVIIDAYERTGNSKYSAMFPIWFEGIKLQNDGGYTDGYTNDFYDDEAWVALTMTRLYTVTKEDRYLTVAKQLYQDIIGGWNEEYLGGGIAWRKSTPEGKNACINGPASLLGFKLYAATGNSDYADFALKVYDWTRENLFDPGSGQVYDNIDGVTGTVNKWDFTYNQGTVMASAYAAYQYTGNDLYLKDARRAANYTITSSSFLDSSINAIMRENGNIPDTGDSGLFRAVFFRYFYDIVDSDDFDSAWHTKFLACLNSSAEVLWRKGIVDRRWVLFSSDWQNGVEVGGTGYLNPQVSACTAIEMRARLEKK